MTTAAVVPDVDPEARVKLLRNLAQGRKWTAARAASGLSDEVAQAVAREAGWPSKTAVHAAWMRSISAAPTVPADPDPALDDHPAVERAMSLTRLVRDRDPDAVARLTGSWSQVELLETCLALAALVPLGVEPEVALEWLDSPAASWPEPVLVVEAGRWDAGARDRTAQDAHDERQRRKSTP